MFDKHQLARSLMRERRKRGGGSRGRRQVQDPRKAVWTKPARGGRRCTDAVGRQRAASTRAAKEGQGCRRPVPEGGADVPGAPYPTGQHAACRAVPPALQGPGSTGVAGRGDAAYPVPSEGRALRRPAHGPAPALPRRLTAIRPGAAAQLPGRLPPLPAGGGRPPPRYPVALLCPQGAMHPHPSSIPPPPACRASIHLSSRPYAPAPAPSSPSSPLGFSAALTEASPARRPSRSRELLRDPARRLPNRMALASECPSARVTGA